MARLEGKTALVTGAARGIGAETARVLAGEGARVIVTDLDAGAGEQVADEIRSSGADAAFMQLDVANEQHWSSAMHEVESEFGALNVLVNNAGIVMVGPIESMNVEDFTRICEVNLTGTFLGMKHALPLMKRSAQAVPAGGSIVNFSSAVGIKGYPFGAAYSMTKGGIRLLSKSAAVEFALLDYKVRVNSIHPGLIETDMLAQETVDHARLGALGASETETRRAFQAMAPVKRFGQPVEIAKAVLFLASDDSAFMTGAELVVDGGDTAA